MGFRCLLRDILHYAVAVKLPKRHKQFMFACRKHCKGSSPSSAFKTTVFYPINKKPL